MVKQTLHLSDLREKRSPYALYLTGEIYHKGLYGETVDLEVAYKFYQEAAELGCKEAEEVLGEGYFLSSTYKCNFLGADNKQ